MPRSLRILCFGDSLTAGYHNYGLDGWRPYSDKLSQILTQGERYGDVHIKTDGDPGKVVASEDWQERLERCLEGEHDFDWLLHLGGTNDLGWGIDPDVIFQHLERSYNQAFSQGIKVLAMTIPETKLRTKNLDQRRLDVNAKILNYKHKDFYSLDLRSKIPYHDLSAEEKSLYWDDGVHLTAEGYDWMGTHIGNALQQILERENLLLLAKEKAQALGGNVESKEAPQEHDVFEEEKEGGNPDKISQGYLVVSKKDID